MFSFFVKAPTGGIYEVTVTNNGTKVFITLGQPAFGYIPSKDSIERSDKLESVRKLFKIAKLVHTDLNAVHKEVSVHSLV